MTLPKSACRSCSHSRRRDVIAHVGDGDLGTWAQVCPDCGAHRIDHRAGSHPMGQDSREVGAWTPRAMFVGEYPAGARLTFSLKLDGIPELYPVDGQANSFD
jgi:ribosomal protein L32